MKVRTVSFTLAQADTWNIQYNLEHFTMASSSPLPPTHAAIGVRQTLETLAIPLDVRRKYMGFHGSSRDIVLPSRMLRHEPPRTRERAMDLWTSHVVETVASLIRTRNSRSIRPTKKKAKITLQLGNVQTSPIAESVRNAPSCTAEIVQVEQERVAEAELLGESDSIIHGPGTSPAPPLACQQSFSVSSAMGNVPTAVVTEIVGPDGQVQFQERHQQPEEQPRNHQSQCHRNTNIFVELSASQPPLSDIPVAAVTSIDFSSTDGNLHNPCYQTFYGSHDYQQVLRHNDSLYYQPSSVIDNEPVDAMAAIVWEVVENDRQYD
eukprot:CAMPEP_0178768140 /NCGR_PEP_ID=MMETSP0744-20121128/20068_1 /TAXON_ID=913974 /ORGANISM="Nitzschia punctata, Strain CCMP561" /LENGTH=320 /DNA_ID=CAMNT_0020424167 /DNA_START=392 /DNA_END=1355 /DNA_ORIENTATION=-